MHDDMYLQLSILTYLILTTHPDLGREVIAMASLPVHTLETYHRQGTRSLLLYMVEESQSP